MHVHVNAAASADGKLSTRRRVPVAISGPADFDRVDALRAAHDAVMVGIGTVLADDPGLTVDEPDRIAAREARGQPAQPARVVADSRARLPTDARLLDDGAATHGLVSEAAPAERVQTLEEAGASVHVAGGERVDLAAGLDALAGAGIDRVMVEGGGELVFSLFAADLVDVLTVYVGSMVLGGETAPTLADGDGFVGDPTALSLEGVERLDDGAVLRWTVQ